MRKIKNNNSSDLQYIPVQTLFIGIQKLLSVKGAKKFLVDNESIEKLITLLFVLGIRKFENRNWYIKNIPNNPPDFEIISFTGKKPKLFDSAIGEIVILPERFKHEKEFDKFVKNTFFKKINKKYESNTTLIIFDNTSRFTDVKNTITNFISDNNNKIRRSPYMSIWIIFLNDVNPKDGFLFSMMQVYPINGRTFIKISAAEEMKKVYSDLPGFEKYKYYFDEINDQ